jgi:tRNA A-37 threonylcarbamoyl transferase component Bud32
VLKTGVVLADRYRLDEPIAAGGVGQVWRATDLVLQRRVAMKLLRPEYADHPETLSRFRAEARHAGALTHSCIAQVYDFRDASPEGPPYLVMELVDGPSLADVLVDEPVNAVYALDVIAKAAAGLAAAHQAGLIHRDIKPGNILLGPDGQVKITDFGIAHAAGSAPITDPGLVMGTTQYLAPERIAGGPGTPGSDLYSLGIVMHECLTGVPPFEGTPAEVMAAHLYLLLPPLPAGTPPEAEDLIARLTAKDPSDRLSSAGELSEIAQRLRAALTTGEAMPRQRQESGISPVTGFPAANESLAAREAGPAARSGPVLSGTVIPWSPPASGAGELAEGAADAPDSPARGVFEPAHGESGALATSGAGAQPRGSGDVPDGSRLTRVLLAGGRPADRRLAAAGIAVLVLAGGGLTSWLISSESHPSPVGYHASLGVVQPSAAPSDPASRTPSAMAGTGQDKSKPHVKPKASVTPSVIPSASASSPAPSPGKSPTPKPSPSPSNPGLPLLPSFPIPGL